MLTILQGDCRDKLKEIPNESIQCCVTSPPYWGLRDYGHPDQIGLEITMARYVSDLVVNVFREVHRVLKADGTLWLNLGDTYASDTKGSGGPDSSSTLVGTKAEHNGQRMTTRKVKHGLKSKDLCGIPWRVAFALQEDGWYLRQDIIWAKPNPMPESVTDRCTKAHEYIFLLTKSARYFYDAEAILEQGVGRDIDRPNGRLAGNPSIEVRGGNLGLALGVGSETRNKRSVWTINTHSYPEAHFATYPPDLIKPCILAGSRPGDVVLDPFFGSGTTGMVALELGRKCIGIELNPDYIELAKRRCDVTPGLAL